MSSKRHRGFALIELLVAVTLTLGIAGVMLTVTIGTLDLWRRTQGNFSAAMQAKLALDMMERDLQAGIFRPDAATTWLAVTVVNSSGGLINQGWQMVPTMKPASGESLMLVAPSTNGRAATIAQSRFGLSGAWLRLLTANLEGEGSLPVAVSYQLARRPVSGTNVSATNPAEVRYALFRSAVSTTNTFVSGNDVLSPNYGSNSESFSTPRASSTLTNPYSPGDTLITNAVDFGVWLYVRELNGELRRIFPADANDLSHTARDGGGAVDGLRYPEVADVMVRILTDEGVRLISVMENAPVLLARPTTFAPDAGWWWSAVEAHSQVFVRRIEFRGGGR